MAMWYGRKDCNHVIRYREDGWVDYCIPAVCIECGAFGCFCELNHTDISVSEFMKEGYKGNANINGKWKNPYVKEEKEHCPERLLLEQGE